FDVAVSLNDWCIHRNTGEFNLRKAQAWLQAYAKVRPFTDTEKNAWPLVLQAAALRFWVSRLYDYFLPRPARTLKPHDPRHFEIVLRARRNGANPALPQVSV
ncbi:MAG: homoserine kinase, partial [Pusillimonas sp.]|nr:homoserine kinase [Pusillimonas sp.]